MKFETISDLHAWLEKIPRFQSAGSGAARFDLDRFRDYCAAAGDPQDRFPSIHIAGTNGKGSTARILASIYAAGGYTVGLYTSPHLVRLNERFLLDGREIADADLLRFFRAHQPLIERFSLTWFEISTAIAFWWFGQNRPDLAILETGLGGRLDATNVVVPELSVITGVSLDHTDILGSTVPEIAREKAGIIKPGVPVLTGRMETSAAAVIAETAARLGSPLHGTGEIRPQLENGVLTLRRGDQTFQANIGPLPPVQRYNMAIGWKAAEVLQKRFPLSEERIRKGMETSAARWPNSGRFERLDPHLQWYFDGAHNVEAVQAMKEAVSQIKPVSESVLVLSLMRDKLREGVMKEFSEFKKIYYHMLSADRAATTEEVKTWLEGVQQLVSGRHAVPPRLKELKTELVIFAGSFYFYETVRDWLKSFEDDR